MTDTGAVESDKSTIGVTICADRIQPIPLTDDEVIDFIIRGYLIVQPDIPAAVHKQVCREFDQNGGVSVDLQNDPLGLELLEKAPTLDKVFNHPVVHGAAFSLLGPDYFVFHRYCHAVRPGDGRVGWHQDDVNVRHYQLRRLMFLYYPQDVTADMGPTYVVPGTHLYNCCTDRMQTYGNIRGQVALTVKAGSVVITHYDIWHTASPNRSDRRRYMVKYYVDRTHEPIEPNWDHQPDGAIPLAMNRMHNERMAWTRSDFYKERHLRWRVWSYLLGQKGPVVWEKWKTLHPSSRTLSELQPEEIQGYLGAPTA